MQRPVWLFSMDSEGFWAAPTTTGALKACYRRYGRGWADTRIELVHFRDAGTIEPWYDRWRSELLAVARAALEQGLRPVAGFSVYTWNAAEFLALMRRLRRDCPELLIVAGGPHVQNATEYLRADPVDVVVLGEGERTFTELLDTPDDDLSTVAGIAWLRDGEVVKNPTRARETDLDSLPSALEVIELTDADGRPRYDAIAYETSRGCPFRCAFCEWGTGAIGTRMLQFSMERVRRDWEAIAAAGIGDIWLADSNFGALKEDLAKAELICELRERTGIPRTFATSWSKKHNDRARKIVLLLHEHGLLPHYQLALQTLTPLALELSNRKNMDANNYRRIAREMAAAGVPIAAELIWGLPGDNLADFEAGLAELLRWFPAINIFGYTLLPGTEFHDRREEYRIETIPVAGYGKAHGEYVVGCHTFDRSEGIEGYFLITAYILLAKGWIMPLTARHLALAGVERLGALLRALLDALLAEFGGALDLAADDRMAVYEHRAALYVHALQEPGRLYACLTRVLRDWFGDDATLARQAQATLALDAAFAPTAGPRGRRTERFDFGARAVLASLQSMTLPAPATFAAPAETLTIESPGGLGEVLRDPDGGGWVAGELVDELAVAPVPATTA